MYQPKTGARCSCKPGVQRDNCSNCEGTGQVVDFAAIRARSKVNAAKPSIASGPGSTRQSVGRCQSVVCGGAPHFHDHNGSRVDYPEKTVFLSREER